MEETSQTISDILVVEKVLTADQANLVNLESLNTGRSQEEVILAHRFASEEKIAPAKAKILGVPFVSLKDHGISPEVLNFVPELVARRYLVLPFEYSKERNQLSIAMADPLDLQAVEFLEKKSSCKIIPHLAVAEELKENLELQY